MMDSKLPLVSIALCTYNGALYLRQQLESILNQTYYNIELIIVDDCSTDDTVEIITQYTLQNQKIKFFQNEKNLGFNKNFEKAIRFSTGKYIAISDQDDIWALNKIETLLNQISDNWLIFSNSAYIDEDGKLLNKNLLNNFSLCNKDFKSLLLYNFVTGHTVLFKKDFLKHVLPLPGLDYYDWYMGFVALYHKKLVYCDTSLTHYRIHQKSFIQNKNSDANLNAVHAAETVHHLTEVSKYKGLSKIDSDLINKLKDSFTNNRFGLTLLIYANYCSFFPDLKPRKGISLLNFAWKYASKRSL